MTGDPPKTDGKDTWDKLAILVRAIGPLTAGVVVALLGYFGSNFLDQQQAKNASIELYAQLINSREEADSSLRKEMFNIAVTAFLASEIDDPDRVIKLELLAHNFHNVLDLAPLFKHLFAQPIDKDRPVYSSDQKSRLIELATQINRKQLAVLESVGAKFDGNIEIENLPDSGIALKKEKEWLQLKESLVERFFEVDILRADDAKKTLTFRLVTGIGETVDLDIVSDVSIFDFPMIRNIRLPGGNRCALVITNLRKEGVEVTFVYFSESRASLKDKPYYDEVIDKLLLKRRAI